MVTNLIGKVGAVILDAGVVFFLLSTLAKKIGVPFSIFLICMFSTRLLTEFLISFYNYMVGND